MVGIFIELLVLASTSEMFPFDYSPIGVASKHNLNMYLNPEINLFAL